MNGLVSKITPVTEKLMSLLNDPTLPTMDEDQQEDLSKNIRRYRKAVDALAAAEAALTAEWEANRKLAITTEIAVDKAKTALKNATAWVVQEACGVYDLDHMQVWADADLAELIIARFGNGEEN